MERNWDVVRGILLQLEARQAGQAKLRSDTIEGVDPLVAAYHMKIMIEAGFLEGSVSGKIGYGGVAFADSLTWKGHEFLDSIREPSKWEKVKSTVKEKGQSLSFEVIQAVATAIAKNAIGLDD